MQGVLATEQIKLDRLKVEYQKYTAAKLIVDKSDIELLSELQSRGVFWTRKLAAVAKHLPDNYWITNFSFSGEDLHIHGFGFISKNQEQLLVLDEYLNRLKADTTFSDTFKNLYLNSATRQEGSGSPQVAFDLSASLPKKAQ
jgi:Tfp pilus assembly protein PilN